MAKVIESGILIAKPTIFTGINQTIMLSLSMVVVSSMIGAGGLGAVVLESISRLQVGQGFAAGLAIVLIAILLDRLTHTLSDAQKNRFYSSWHRWTGLALAAVMLVMAIFSMTQMGTPLGLVVLHYVTIQSIDEPTSFADCFGKQIIGIDPGAGIMKGTQTAIQKYQLPLKLVQGSDSAMTAALAKAIHKKQWIVVTGWKPHSKFSQYKLKFLADPKGVYGTKESIYTIVRKGLKEDKPQVYQILDRFHWTNEEMQEVMLQIHKGQSPMKPPKIGLKNILKK